MQFVCVDSQYYTKQLVWQIMTLMQTVNFLNEGEVTNLYMVCVEQMGMGKRREI